ncbi:NTP transferase domain-containing protein [Bradyrhizobium sp. CNPSo 4010]|uniref:NTP transferase domain-containing protein n=1 Tax=Bradyrhizobium agreste TaxID=2751811 RepID=A0ABS0PW98_9BRAD|nr:sugar phosphate nucleotidyltransferase [Bradyrhizobium agreste]MBH5401201.1 NTP transferase domain-containing protein [Bradyrhizobium agreste]
MLTQAVILVGGLGTRLGERTRAVPKPLLDVGGKPFLEYILDQVSRYPTIEKILLLAGHRAEQVVERYHGRTWRRAAVSVICEPTQLGTGGALKHAAAKLEPQFLLLNGDSFFDFNLLDLAAFGSATMVRVALKKEHPGDRYGRVLLERGSVRRFQAPGTQPNGPINAGIYRIDRRILDLIDQLPCSLEQSVFPRLIEMGQLEAAVYEGFFIDIGIPEDLERAQREFPARMRRPAVFFSDDALSVDNAHVQRIQDFNWISGAREAIKLCNDRGYLTFVVTNQSGDASNCYGGDAVHKLHDRMSHELAKIGAHIDEFQHCRYHEDGAVEQWRRASDRRKPGMILDCFAAWPLQIESSLLVGNHSHEVQAAVAAGIAGHLFKGRNLETFIRLLLGKGRDQEVAGVRSL